MKLVISNAEACSPNGAAAPPAATPCVLFYILEKLEPMAPVVASAKAERLAAQLPLLGNIFYRNTIP